MSEGEGLPVVSDGDWLVSNRAVLDRGEARWLMRLGRFEMSRGYEAEGFGRVIDWLGAKLKMGRSSAFEKVRVARQMRLRPALADGFMSGRICYSAARAIARLEDPDAEVDEALVELAARNSPRDVENVVRFYTNHKDQHRCLSDAIDHAAGVTTRRRADGLSEIRAVCTDVEADEINALLSMFIPESEREQQGSEGSTAVDSDDDGGGLVEFRQRIDCEQKAKRVTGRQRLQGLLDALRTAGNHQDGAGLAGADRYLTHLVVVDDDVSLSDGTYVPPAQATKIGCDCSVVEHHYNPKGELLWLGRKTRNWTTAQRRAARVRDGGCRFPGCSTAGADLHHIRYWERGGRTDISNGLSLCEHHHTIVHEHGIEIHGDPNATTRFTFHSIDVGTTKPIVRSLPKPMAA